MPSVKITWFGNGKIYSIKAANAVAHLTAAAFCHFVVRVVIGHQTKQMKIHYA